MLATGSPSSSRGGVRSCARSRRSAASWLFRRRRRGGDCGSTSFWSPPPRSARSSSCARARSTLHSAPVFEGRAVELPSRLLVVPLLAWAGGVLLLARLLLALAMRLPTAAPPGFGALLPGLAVRSLKRRPWELAAGIVALGLVVAFGTSLRAFIATYDAAKSADAGFVVGSDLRITPGVAGAPPRTSAYASQLRVGGVSAVTPVVSGLENSVLIGAYRRSTTDLAAIDPATFGRVARLSGSSFEGGSASAAMTALRADPHGVLVDATTAGELSIESGDRVRVVLALGTPRETRRQFRVAGLFTRLAGFARPPNLVVGLGAYAAATTSRRIDYFLARTSDHSHAGLARAVAALRSGGEPLAIETTEGAFDKDQSSLTALDVRSLVDLGSLFTLLMSAAVIAIFTFGLILQRRRELSSCARRACTRAKSARSCSARRRSSPAAGSSPACSPAPARASCSSRPCGRCSSCRRPSPCRRARWPACVLAAVAATFLSAAAAMLALRQVRPTEILREP